MLKKQLDLNGEFKLKELGELELKGKEERVGLVAVSHA